MSWRRRRKFQKREIFDLSLNRTHDMFEWIEVFWFEEVNEREASTEFKPRAHTDARHWWLPPQRRSLWGEITSCSTWLTMISLVWTVCVCVCVCVCVSCLFPVSCRFSRLCWRTSDVIEWHYVVSSATCFHTLQEKKKEVTWWNKQPIINQSISETQHRWQHQERSGSLTGNCGR